MITEMCYNIIVKEVDDKCLCLTFIVEPLYASKKTCGKCVMGFLVYRGGRKEMDQQTTVNSQQTTFNTDGVEVLHEEENNTTKE